MYTKDVGDDQQEYTFYMFFLANNDDEWWNIEQKADAVDDANTEAVFADDSLVYESTDQGSTWTLDGSGNKVPVYKTYGACCSLEDTSENGPDVLYENCCLNTSNASLTSCDDQTRLMTDTTAGEKNFRVLFQMGDEDSDWQGVKYQITKSVSDTLMDSTFEDRETTLAL